MMDELMREVLVTKGAVYLAVAMLFLIRGEERDKLTDAIFALVWFVLAVVTIISAYR